MKTYNVKISATPDIDWSAVDVAKIDEYKWNDRYTPNAGAQVVYVKSGDEREGIYAHLFCDEANPRAIYGNHNEPVYLDDCLEFFFTFSNPDGAKNGYINIESNSNPTTLIAYGFDRNARTPIIDMGIEPFTLSSVKSPERWELFEFVPLSVIKQVFGVCEVTEQTYFAGNFYKCGGNHEDDPYGSWSPITAPEPDFHRPECFGRLMLVK